MLIPLGLDDARLSRVPWVSLGVAGACLAIHAVAGEHVEGASFDLCLVPSLGFLQSGWLTAPFAHATWPHLLGNLLFFFLCAPFLEDAWGHRAFLGFYLAALVERPGDVSARLDLARLALDAGKLDEAVSHLERLANATSVQPGQLRELVEAVGLARLRPATALLLAERLEQSDHLLAIDLADAAATAGGRLGARALVTGAEIALRHREFHAAQARAARALAAPALTIELRARAAPVEAAARERFDFTFDPAEAAPQA